MICSSLSLGPMYAILSMGLTSTRARLSSGTHHPDADVVSEDLQGDREVPVVENDTLARAK